MVNVVLGVDIGGSHVTSAQIDMSEKKIVENTWARERVDSNGPAEDVIEAWAETIEKSLNGSKLSKIGFAMPGPMDYKAGTSLMKGQGKYEQLYGLNIKDMLAERLGIDRSDIAFTNDAACFLRGELFTGYLNDPEHVIGLTLGTGLGSTCVVNGQVEDANLWDIPFHNSIAEDYISTRWFIKRFHVLSGIQIKDVKDLIENYSEKTEFTIIFKEFSDNLADFIIEFARRKNATSAVLGGNIAHAEKYFIDATTKRISSALGFHFAVTKSVLGERAALLGAVAV